MNDVLIADICSVLTTMKGYPPYPPPANGSPSAMDQAYFAGLHDLPDSLGERVRSGVLLAFDERPSVKSLREWAISLAPPRVFDIRQLDAPAAPRLMTGPLLPLSTGIPDSVKVAFARFRAQVPDSELLVPESPRRSSVHCGVLPDRERGKWQRDARRWLKARGVNAPSPLMVAHTAEARWRESKRRAQQETRTEQAAPAEMA